MKNLFEPSTVDEVKERMSRLRPDCTAQWGRMNAGQAVAHCAAGMELALGDRRPPRMLIGRILGPFVKSRAFVESELMRRNSPTVPGLAVEDQRELGVEQERLCGLIDRFAAAGPAGCSTHPHSFFGRLTPEEWSVWMYSTSTITCGSLGFSELSFEGW